jgi:hypothetical protein
MDLATLIDIFLHLDRHLSSRCPRTTGPWVYALLFLIIFVETGLVVMPILPGDSLLFAAGTIAGLGGMSLPVLLVLLIVAAVLGDALNYSVGRWLGPRVFQWENSRWFNKAAFERTHNFYEKSRSDHHRGRALPAVRAHLRALRGRHRAHDVSAIRTVQRGGCRAVGRHSDHPGLPDRQYRMGQGAFFSGSPWPSSSCRVCPRCSK